MALLNTGHLIWFLRQRFAEEPASAELAERQLAVDRSAVELHTDNDAVRIRAIIRLLELVAAYEDDPAFRPEWREFPQLP
jgi:hypothetical protein